MMAGNTQFITLDPTGNVTCLVLSSVAAADRPRITAGLMDRCEQVGYLCPAGKPGARARLEMMGGEFCGNATMALGAYLAREDGLRDGEEAFFSLEVSGVEETVPCRIRREGDAWRGTVDMPLPTGMEETDLADRRALSVTLPGMTHLILPEGHLEKKEAEALLGKAALRFSAPALGLLQWDEARAYMTPLVYVRGSETMVWETACGSGTTAIACWRARMAGHSLRTAVRQPGGLLEAEAEMEGGVLCRILLTGTVRIGEMEILETPAAAGPGEHECQPPDIAHSKENV